MLKHDGHKCKNYETGGKLREPEYNAVEYGTHINHDLEPALENFKSSIAPTVLYDFLEYVLMDWRDMVVE